MERHKISASGKIYWEYLKGESEKVKLEKDAIEANLNNNIFAKRIAIFTTLVTLFVTYLQIKSCERDEKRELWQVQRALQDSIQQSKISETDSLTNQRLREISLSLSDTAKVKVKIEN